MHVSLSQAIFQAIDRRDLIAVGRLEQELIFGEKKSKDIITHLQGWNAMRCVAPPVATARRVCRCCSGQGRSMTARPAPVPPFSGA
jgi:hypothetical protein